jgi:hypothetical protein
VANFLNGNDAAFNSRAYLWNPSQSPGNVTVRVFTLPIASGLAQELTAGPLSLGTLAAKSALSIKLAEDILTPLGITTPYITDGGNLTLEFTIQAADVRGAAQVFSSDFAFGVYPLQQIPSASSGNPTLLVANFMNGNNNAFNSRIYLWNPSQGAGDVTVRVFTLPITGGLARELTAGPLSLGILAAKSALNVKLAEDILMPLGITTPYIIDGGNLTLEFTIQATDVRGAAQVFSSDFAFGTYPLQEIPSTSAGNPTVLVANFMNGNNDAFNSRIYLWNPSQSPGNVTVRVFTLPIAGGLAQELTAGPLSLGTLAAKSALNIKLVEDILMPLGITTPYIIDGGNLTLEFTIQAADVRGAAQVFSSDFAFGTYPLQGTLGQVTLEDRLDRANVFLFVGVVDESDVLAEIAADAVWGDVAELPEDENHLAAVAALHQRRGITHFSNISAGDPFESSLEALPELNAAACLDIDLKPMITEAGFQVFLPLMDTLEPRWQQFLKDQTFIAIDAGAEGTIVDEIQGTSLNPGCFNQVDMAGFREFLQEEFTPQDLQSQFGITDIATFDYGEFIRSMDLAETWKQQWYQVPLSMEFRIFQTVAIQEFWTDLIAESKQYARENFGRDFLFSGNVSSLEQFSIMFANALDFYTLEFPYFPFIGFPPAGKTIPASKLSRAFRGKKAVFLTQVSTNGELVRRGNVNNLMKIYVAESYSAQSEFMIPFKIFSGGPVGYSADLSVIAPYYGFIQNNRVLYEEIQLLNPRVGLLYSFPSNFYANYWFLNSFYGASYALLDSQIQHDVLFSGDDFMLQDTLTAEQLNKYDVLVLPNSRNLSNSQIQLILDYVKSGGTVLAWAEIGIANERDKELTSPERTALNALTTPGSQTHGNGTFIYFTEDLGSIYFDERTVGTRDKISQEILARIDRQIEVDAPNNVDVLGYTSETDQVLIFHIINYNYNIDTDTITPVPSLGFTFQLPTGFEMENKQFYLLSPDRDAPELLNFQQSGNAITTAITGTQFYDVLAIVPEAFASSEAHKEIQKASLNRERAHLMGLHTSSVTPLFQEIEGALSQDNFLKAKDMAGRALTRLAEITKPAVLFDEMHEEVNTLSEERALQLDPGNPEFHFFGKFKKDVELDYALTSLTEGEISPEVLQNVSVLILSAPSDPSFAPEETLFSQSEIDAILNFVQDGGGLLFMGDCCLFNFSATSSSINELLSNFEIQFIPGGLSSLNPERPEFYIFDVKTFASHPVTENVEEIQAIAPGHLTIANNAEGIAFTDSGTFRDLNGNGVQDPDEDSGPFVFMAVANFGSGKVVALADNDFTDPIYEFDSGKKLLLMQNILRWLSAP